MDETQKQEEVSATDNTGEGDKSTGYRAIDDANLAAKRLEEANKIAKEENDRRDRQIMEMKLGGDTDAGSTKGETEEDRKKKAVLDFWDGSVVGDAIKKHG